ncbi:MAG: FixH family protein [Thiobacillaceae bacterium]
MNETFLTLFGGLVAVIALFVALARFPNPLRALIAAGIPLLVYFFLIIGAWPGMDVVAIHIAVFSGTAFVMLMTAHFRARGTGKLHWAPKALIGFFLVLTVLMGTFLYISTDGLPPRVAAWVLPGADKSMVRTGFSGVLEHGEEAANAINSHLGEQYRQNHLGWDVALQGLSMPNRGENQITVEVGDAATNQPFSGLTAVLHAKRPGDPGEGQAQVMNDAGQGRFSASVTLPNSGLWLVSLTLTRGEDRFRREWEVQVP